MSSRYDQMKETLLKLIRDNPHIDFAEIVSTDGLPIISSIDSPEEESKIAAMAAAISGVAERFATELKKGKIDQVSLFADNGGVIIVSITPEAYLAVTFTAGAKLGLILHDINMARRKLSEFMS
ncbi:MAG: roadblock/LC7 domain-containing protein [Thermoproteales archaeon]|nr:roadblock/LC7 domain-containing protein [Thermoproteales archaeon]